MIEWNLNVIKFFKRNDPLNVTILFVTKDYKPTMIHLGTIQPLLSTSTIIIILDNIVWSHLFVCVQLPCVKNIT